MAAQVEDMHDALPNGLAVVRFCDRDGLDESRVTAVLAFDSRSKIILGSNHAKRQAAKASLAK